MTTSQKIIKNNLGVLGLAQQLENVSKACSQLFTRAHVYLFITYEKFLFYVIFIIYVT